MASQQRVNVGETELAFEVEGAGSRLVWCHGLASCRDGDRDVIDGLVASGFTVLSYDARGHGRSAPVYDAGRFAYRVLAEDLVALLEHVGWDRAVYAGASMGAATAARAAALWPEHAAALVMARPGAADPEGRVAPGWLQAVFAGGAHAIRSGGIDGAIAYLHSIPLARAALEADPRRLDALRSDWERHDPLSIAAALEGVPRTSPLEGGIRPGDIRCPTLVVPGSDLIHPTEAGERLARAIPGAALAPPFDSLPRHVEVAQFVALVGDFVARVEAAA